MVGLDVTFRVDTTTNTTTMEQINSVSHQQQQEQQHHPTNHPTKKQRKRRCCDTYHTRDCAIVSFSMAAEAEFAFLVAKFGLSEQL